MATRKTKNETQGLNATQDDAGAGTSISLDPIIHERTRLAIISTLAVNEALSFGELKKLLKLTDGNLSVHAQKLEKSNYIQCKKLFRGRTPRTEYRITKKGRDALSDYLDAMEGLIQAVKRG